MSRSSMGASAMPGSDHSLMEEMLEQYNNDAPARAVYAALVVLFSFTLGTFFGIRIGTLNTVGQNLRQMEMIHALSIAVFMLSCAFIMSVAVLLLGYNVSTKSTCSAATYICISIYIVTKIVMQLFLIERVHLVRRHEMTRRQDKLWLACIGSFSIGGTAIVMDAYFEIGRVLRPTKACLILLPLKQLIVPLIIWQIIADTSLTLVFCLLLRPYMKQFKEIESGFDTQRRSKWSTFRDAFFGERANATLVSSSDRGLETGQPDAMQTTTAMSKRTWIHRVLYRSVIGTLASVTGMVINVSVIVHFRGNEKMTICLISCTIDVCLTTAVLYWLTSGNDEVEPPNDSKGLSTGSSTGTDNELLPMRGIKVTTELNVHECAGFQHGD